MNARNNAIGRRPGVSENKMQKNVGTNSSMSKVLFCSEFFFLGFLLL